MHSAQRTASALDLSQLIGLIYQTASDAACWETLLERMSANVAMAQSARATLTARALDPHFMQADRMLNEQSNSEYGLDLLEQTLNHLPLGMAIIDFQGKVFTHNARLLAMLQQHPLWSLQRMVLRSEPAKLLLTALKQLELGSSSELPMQLGGAHDPHRVALWLSRLAMPLPNGDAVLLIASDQHQSVFATDALQRQFGLTPAEARLTQQLLLGLSTEEAARQLGVSLNTARTHLKQVFTKCGIKRQSELMKAMYQSPMWLASGVQFQTVAKPQATLMPLPSTARHTVHSLTLPDGRRMAYVDRGDPHGIPLVFTRGILGSRLAVSPDEEILRAKGIRLLVPDRPGCGASDPHPQPSLLHWAQDVQCLAQQLGISRWHMMGFATGAAYALACAHALPGQVAAALLVGAAPEVRSRADLQFFRGDLKHGLTLCRFAPTIVRRLYTLLTKNVERRVHQYFNDTLSTMPMVDQQVFSDPAIRRNEALSVLEGTAQGNPTFLNEMFIAASPWGFELKGITPPLSFWHGAQDPYVSWKASEKMAAQCNQAHFHLLEDGGQYLIFSHWAQLLDEVQRLHQPHGAVFAS